ncbi:hypothetical protein M9Y10_042197 [Tritrichomonas musculus]|uniref:Uncharacterized protein n=1 Tax=Tritrichomonas musculus TaxID=1915356 RepID=A0ABR2K6N9_9EUKA
MLNDVNSALVGCKLNIADLNKNFEELKHDAMSSSNEYFMALAKDNITPEEFITMKMIF